MKVNFLYTVFLFFLIASCNSRDQKADKQSYDLDSINTSAVHLYADERTSDLLNQLGDVYHAHFSKASLKAAYTSDSNAMHAMLSDSTRMVVLQRGFTTHEIDQLKLLHQAKPLQYTFAYSAIALVRTPISEIGDIDSTDLYNKLRGDNDVFVTTKDYKEIYLLLLKNLGLYEVKHRLDIVNNVDELSKYLDKYPNRIGVLPFSIVSDQYDPEAKSITKKFKWLGIKKSNGEIVYPSQSTIFTQEWPFVIPYTIAYCNLSLEDGVGFVKFIHTKPASRLILKAGLIPASLPDRDVRVEPQSFSLK